MSEMEAALVYARGHRDEHLERLMEVLRIPSISTLPEHAPNVQRTAEWLAARLDELGMTKVEIMPTGGHPIVYGEWLEAAGKPTVLVYGHYDVQPVDPVDEWQSPPFEPTVRDENLYARGASDMKGQLVAFLTACASLKAQGPLPVNVKFMLEGEEEVGSPNLPTFIEKHRDLLQCDVVVNTDSGIFRPDLPGIVYALRGIAYFQIELRGASKDLHSGVFGGTVQNPLDVLCGLLAGMHDDDGRVTLPGFYDDVLALCDEEREVLAKVPHDDEQWKAMAGVKVLWGEKGYSTVERVGARPCLDINGIWGGFTGEGSKTVLPAKASAKVSMRLVPNQTGEAAAECLRAYLTEHAPETVTWEVRDLAHGPAAVMQRDSAAMQAAKQALEDVFGKEPLFKREGGSVPVVGHMQQALGVDTVMLGFALPDDGVHGPNEKQHVPTFFNGIETYIRFLSNLA